MPIALTAGQTLGLALGLLLFERPADRSLKPGSGAALLRNGLFLRDPLVAREVILSVLEVLAGIFAMTITVDAIIVQLSATRYTSRVVDLFLADRFTVMRVFVSVVPLIDGFWLVTAATPDLLACLREERLSLDSQEFWKIEDRGVSFYTVEPSQRASVSECVAWLTGEKPPPANVAQSA